MSKKQYLKDLIDFQTLEYCNNQIDLFGLSTTAIKRLIDFDIFSGINPFKLKVSDVYKPIITMYLNDIVNTDKRYIKLWVGLSDKHKQKYAIFVNRNIVKSYENKLFKKRKTRKQIEYEEHLNIMRNEKSKMNKIVTKKQLEIAYNEYFD